MSETFTPEPTEADPDDTEPGQVADGESQETTEAFVIVGVDGSSGSQLAIDWAATKAEALGPVKPVAAFHVDAISDGVALPGLYQDVARLMADGASAELVRSLEDDHPDLLARSAVIRGYAGPALVRAAEGQRLLVVGSRGRSALAETMLGSVTSYCVKHASVPVAVIPESTPTDEPLRHIVVGVDGSDNCAAALRWALAHVADGGRVTALTAWMQSPWGIELIPPTPDMTADARKMAERLVRMVLEETGQAGGAGTATVEVVATMGDPRTVLAAAAGDADLLVVGTRGYRGVTHLLLGSCTTSLIHHPTVATVVVPVGWPEPPSDE